MWILRTGSSVVALVFGLLACGHAPRTVAEKMNIETRAQATLQEMIVAQPALRDAITSAYAYAVFPEIGKGGFIVGGAHGRGVLYVQGTPTGYVELNQGSIGAQLGGQTFAELIVFQNDRDVARLEDGDFKLGADINAVVLSEGKAVAIDTDDDVSVFVKPRGGLMAGIAITGQTIDFVPRG